jgi:hypothetical protein
MLLLRFCVLTLVVFACAQLASAAPELIFTEDFTDNSANWANFNSGGFLTHFATGGPDGGAYASGPRVFGSLVAGNITVIHRARYDFGASGGAFNRDWVADGIRVVTANVRHNLPGPATYFVRVAHEDFFPGGSYLATQEVLPNTWTELFFDVSANSPQLAGPDALEGEPWSSTFSNVGHVQFGVIVPGGLTGNTNPFTFDIDKVSILTPEPSTIAIAGLGLVGATCGLHRRRRTLIGTDS